MDILAAWMIGFLWTDTTFIQIFSPMYGEKNSSTAFFGLYAMVTWWQKFILYSLNTDNLFLDSSFNKIA